MPHGRSHDTKPDRNHDSNHDNIHDGLPQRSLARRVFVFILFAVILAFLFILVLFFAAGFFGAPPLAQAASAPAPAQAPGNSERSMILTDHPLSDSLWNTRTGQKASVQELADAIAGARYLLLGEKHDNPRHHALQARMIEEAAVRIAPSGRKGHVILEMLEPHYQPALDAISQKAAETVVSGPEAQKTAENLTKPLGLTLEWETRGWPDWALYQPIFTTALAHHMTLHAGNPERDDLLAAGRKGILSDDLQKDLRWELDYDVSQRDSLTEELVAAHCGMMGPGSVGPLMTMQRLKDAHMARAMRQAGTADDLSILIAGNGHTRKDRGVPMFLEPGKTVVSVSFMEVMRGSNDPATYPGFDPALYDFVWFTPRVDEIDPCEKFKEQLKAMQHGQTSSNTQ
ncbi:ChaN family lipoprotein [Cohaesibacter haloalkalitolerans]|uniref:ChaN family lipoprotein n=1 Tax=Cohaesibacter haloalkalitolerans TaxID=1162980 RepID=UPI000E65DA70|nr:ChaN family lipoprotein [Cohaesibacter haloalkalitolerans]